MLKYIYFLLFLATSAVYPQFGTIQIIDDTKDSGGAKRILTADLNQDGFEDVITARAYNFDHICFYTNQGDGTFSEKNMIDVMVADPNDLAVGDFNDDGWPDVATITQTNGEVFWYPNSSGSFSTRNTVDEGIFHGNGLVAADFDNDGFDDLVAIGQHSIDFYKNDGTGDFNKEHISTTETSPNILECLYIEAADIDHDGNMDVVTGETIGGVIYFNDGTGTFASETFTQDTFITTLVHVFDANGDSFNDIVTHNNTGKLDLYLNNGNGSMVFERTIANIQTLHTMQHTDVNSDGHPDLYTAYNQKARVLLNGENLNFDNELIVQENDDFFILEVAIGKIHPGANDMFIWSGSSSTLAYQENTILGLHDEDINIFGAYPNPVTEILTIELTSFDKAKATLYDPMGKTIFLTELNGTSHQINLSMLASGVYYLNIKSGNQTEQKKLIKL